MAPPRVAPDHRRLLPPHRIQQLGIAVACLAAVLVFATFVDGIYPIATWLTWRVLALWGWVAILHLACLAMGARVAVDWLAMRDRPLLETLVLSLAVGVVAWVQALTLAGAVHAYGRPLLFALPTGFLLAGAGPLLRLCKRWHREQNERASGSTSPQWLVGGAVVAFGTLCLGLMYLQLFSPNALNYDSVWCHLTVAETYAREGGLVPFLADYAKNMPQLTPMFHLWGFLVPGLNQPLRWMFALHNEFALFLWTLVAVAAAVRWILGQGPRARGSWAAFFLFPGIFVYDSNIGGAADHVLAFFALPMVLAAARLGERPSVRKAILFGILAGGALLTKYQAAYVLIPVAGMLGLTWLLHMRRHTRGVDVADAPSWRELARVPAVALGTLVLVAAPHFLRNLIFYRNPVYPFMQDVFTGSRPSVMGGAFLVSHVFTDITWQPQGTLAKKLGDALVLFGTFSFKPHYYYEFHHNVPSFGSLFTLLLPAVPFLGWQPRLWRMIGCASTAIFVWAMTFLVDRNLQTFLPLLVAATAAMIALAWSRGRVARLGLIPLVLFQVVWGADAMFYSGYERMRSAVDLIRSGFAGTVSTRFANTQAAYLALGAALPPDATVLLHGSHAQLGINRRVFLDWAGFQGLIDYRRFRSVGELDAAFRSLGITHVARDVGQRPGASRQEDVLLALYLSENASSVGTYGGLELLALPVRPPATRRPSSYVVLLGVRGHVNGGYRLERLGTQEGLIGVIPSYPSPDFPLPLEPARWPAFLQTDLATVVGDAGGVPSELLGELERHHRRQRVSPVSLQIYAPN